MNRYPLLRTSWTNEHVMAGVFLVTVLYHIPAWVVRPAGMWEFAAVLAVGLLLDTVANFVRFKRPVCSVSAAVTAGILNVLTPGVPVVMKLIGAAIALQFGKHVWGGTGKNPVNPAVLGALILTVWYDAPVALFRSTPALLPAIVLSLPVLRTRPFSGVGMAAGAVAALALRGNLSWTSVLVQGIFFWSCLIATDPVTVTRRAWVGGLGAFLVGLSPALGVSPVLAWLGGILGLNLLSLGADRVLDSAPAERSGRLHLKNPYRESPIRSVDLTNEPVAGSPKEELPAPADILHRVEANGVFGMGGAAFPTHRKIRTVMDSKAEKRYFIVNGVECDPGLVHDHWLLRHRMPEITRGIELVRQCAPFDRVILAVRDGKEIEPPPGVTVQGVPDVYPTGAERLLIRRSIGVSLPEEAIPAQEGILVLNVQTVYAIWEAVIANRKIDSRFITVADPRNGAASAVHVKLGIPIHEVANRVVPGRGVVFHGGGQMQCGPSQDEDVVEPGTNYIARAAFPRYKESPQCSRCGLCAATCPAGLDVQWIAELVDAGKMDEARKHGAKKCMSCGSCSYVCLAGRNLSARMVTVKNAG